MIAAIPGRHTPSAASTPRPADDRRSFLLDLSDALHPLDEPAKIQAEACRVLGRRVEHALLAELVSAARKRGLRRLVGTYIPTARNGLVEDHYAKLGFSLLERREDGTTVWEFPTDRAPEARLPMDIQRPPGAVAA
mgnify:CR=1 FL=1